MMFRLSLSLLLVLNCTFLNGMDAKAEQMLTQAQEMMGPFKELMQSVVEKAKKEDRDEVDAKSLSEYYEKTVNLKQKLLTTVQVYKTYFDKFNHKDKITYADNILSLKTSTHDFFTNYLSRPARAQVYLTHPESFAFAEAVDKAKSLVDKAEASSNNPDGLLDTLLLDDLLLSSYVNGLKKMLETVKEQSKAK